jgi:hypothetical protein
MELLHSNGTESGASVVRLLVFGVWAAIFCVDPIQQLAELPLSALNPPGLQMLVPRPVVEFLFLEPVLVVLRVSGAGMCFAAALSVFSPLTTLAAAGCVFVVQSLERSLGYINHSEILFVLSVIMFAGFSAADWVTSRDTNRRIRGNPPDASDTAPLLLMTLATMFVLSYQFAAINRVMTVGLEGTLGESLVFYMVRHTARDTFWSCGGGWLVYESDMLRVMAKGAFLLTTLVELTLPLALLLRRARWFYVFALAAFHMGTFFTMNTVFLQMLLLVLLTDISRWAAAWFVNRAGGVLRRSLWVV